MAIQKRKSKSAKKTAARSGGAVNASKRNARADRSKASKPTQDDVAALRLVQPGWKPGTVAARIPFRVPLSPDHRRSVADIALAELTDLVLRHSDALEEDDPPLIYARLMQIDRLETHFAAAETARLKPG